MKEAWQVGMMVRSDLKGIETHKTRRGGVVVIGDGGVDLGMAYLLRVLLTSKVVRHWTSSGQAFDIKGTLLRFTSQSIIAQ